MIRTDVIVKYAAIDGLRGLVNDYPDFVEDSARSVLARIEPDLLYELRYTPGKPKYPIQWTSAKQRRAFFATNGFGKGIPYRRTGKLAKSYRLKLLRNANEIKLSIENTAAYSPFVVGRLRPRGVDPQQRFHKITGWQPAAPTIDFWVTAFQEDLADELELTLSNIGGYR